MSQDVPLCNRNRIVQPDPIAALIRQSIVCKPEITLSYQFANFSRPVTYRHARIEILVADIRFTIIRKKLNVRALGKPIEVTVKENICGFWYLTGGALRFG